MAELLELVDRGIELVNTGERSDLRRRLEQTRARLLDPSTRVMVVGEFKQGKSQLVNALLNAPVCPVDDDIATSVPTVVRYGEVPSALVLKAGESEDAELIREPVPLDEVAAHVSERGNPGNERQLLAAEVFLPRQILAGGLSLVDTPGVGGLGSSHALTTLTALPSADAVILVSDASQEYTEPEIQFLRHAMRICPNVACVVSKTDLYPKWREVVEIDRGHLGRLGGDIPLLPVSSELRLAAARLQDPELNAESGFPALVGFLRNDIVGKSARLQQRSVSQDLVSVTDHLGLSLRSELSALTNPEGKQQIVAELEAAKEKAGELRRRSARWQVTLNDGVADLIADMEYDLRDRMRKIQREAEQAIEKADPGAIWEQLVDWLEQRVAAAVSDTFVWTNERARWLSQEVAEHFAEGRVALPVLKVDDTHDVLDPVEKLAQLDPGHLRAMEKVLIGMRGSYGGVLMIGLLTGIMGMALINPFSVAAGVLIGGKAYRDDKEARLKRRQAEARSMIRHQVDEVIFQVGKQLKDRLRLVQRATRDHFTEIADEHHRSLADSVLAAQNAATTYTADRDQRVTVIRAELGRVDALHKQAQELEPAPVPAAIA